MPQIVGSIDNVDVPTESEEEVIPESAVENNDTTQEEEISPDEELWEGGPTKADIDGWKEQYSDVYLTEVGGESRYIIWRTIARKEYRNLVLGIEKAVEDGKISREQANLDNEEAIARICILYPDLNTSAAIQNDLGGIPSLISQQVMEASAFVSYQVRKL